MDHFPAQLMRLVTSRSCRGSILLLALSVCLPNMRAQTTKSQAADTGCAFPGTCGAWAIHHDAVAFARHFSETFQASQAPITAHSPQQEPSSTKKPPKQYSPSANAGSPGHIFWVVPAFKVNYGSFKPLTPREKFQEFAESVYDPLGLAAGGVEAATLEYSSTDGFCGYGHGWAGYGKCYGSMQLDATVSSFIGDYALTVLLHQDPRYFRLGKGNFGQRLFYSISRVFITFNDSGHNTFYTSALTGTAVAGIVSNLYYPKQDVGVGPTISRIGIDLGNTELYNAAAEFWPDFNGFLHRTLHPHRSRSAGAVTPSEK